MDPQYQPSRTRRWLAPVVITLGAWLVAFLVVTLLLTFFRHELQSLPVGLRALLISGVLVTLMANLVMPFLTRAVTRWVPGPAQPPRSAARPGTRPGKESRV